MLKLIRAFLNAGVMEKGLVSDDGGDAPGRPAVAIPVQHRAGRTGPRAGTTGPLLCALRGRLQHLRAQRTGRTAGDGEHYRLHHQETQDQETQAEGKPVEKRGGQAREAEVPGIQLYGRQRAKAAGCPSGSGPVQGAGPGPDAADANGGTGRNGQGTV